MNASELYSPATGSLSPNAYMLRLPVRAEAYEGLADVRGMLVFDGRQLRFDFQTRDSILGVLKSDMRQLAVPLAAVAKVRAGRGWFWLNPYIELELNDFALLNKVPGAHDGSWRLRVRFSDRAELRRFVDAVAFARAGQLHDSLELSLQGAQLNPSPRLPEAAVDVVAPPPRRREVE
jgi:hypothetical protein